MSKKALMVTVGGSPDPLLTAVKELRPDRVTFCASESTKKCVDDPGKPNERRTGADVEKLPCLVKLMDLQDYVRERDLVELEEIDDVQACYRQMAEKVRELRAEGFQEILVDYTGGTKSMAAALVCLALDEELLLNVTTGMRTNNRAVERGQTTREVGVTDLRARRTLQVDVENAFKESNYGAAETTLRKLLRPRDLSSTLRRRVQNLMVLCEGLTIWDAFDHPRALSFIDNPDFCRLGEVRIGLVEPLRRLNGVHSWLESSAALPKGVCGYEMVDDLLNNARRRAQAGRFDDAVGRLYRALEMLAQFRLRVEYGVDTGSVDLKLIPESQQESLRAQADEKGEIVISLMRAYTLLENWPDPLVGAAFKELRKPLENALKTRNYSLFAHGYRCVSMEDYKQFSEVVEAFIDKLLAQVMGKHKRIPQLPRTIVGLFEGDG